MPNPFSYLRISPIKNINLPEAPPIKTSDNKSSSLKKFLSNPINSFDITFAKSTGPAVGPISALEDGTSIYIKNGYFLTSKKQNIPQNIQKRSQNFYMAARSISNSKESFFSKLSLNDKKAIFTSIQENLVFASPKHVSSDYKNSLEAAQMRSSSATLLRGMVQNLDKNNPSEKILQDSALKVLALLIDNEVDSELRNHMMEHLKLIRQYLPQISQVYVDTIYDKEISKKPTPTGPVQIEVCCTSSDSFENEIRMWEDEGFNLLSSGTTYENPTILEKNITTQEGVQKTIRKKLVLGTEHAFKAMGDPDVDIVVYSGHSNWGLDVPKLLKNAPDATGKKKTVLIHQCCGQGIINSFREKYGNSIADLETTRYPSLENEDFFAYKKISLGIANNTPWAKIHDQISTGVFDMIRRLNSRDNYMTKADLLGNLKARDSDGDGISDLQDVLYDMEVVSLDEDSKKSFSPQKNSKHNSVISGLKIHNTALTVNMALSFSRFIDHKKSENPFIGGGYFRADPNSDDVNKIVRIVEENIDLNTLSLDKKRANLSNSMHKVYKVQLNERFSHVPEHILKALTMMEVGLLIGKGATQADRILQGLILATFALDIDNVYGNERKTFDLLRKYYGLPKEIVHSEALEKLKIDHNIYAGSDKSIQSWKESLDDRTIGILNAGVKRKFI